MKVNGTVIIFDTDDEMTDYVLDINPTVFPKEINGQTYYGYDYSFTDNYNNAINNGMTFKVRAKDSKIMKRGCVNRGLITKKISNLAK